MKVWITKYALTKGLFEMSAEITHEGKYATGKHNGYTVFTHQYARTRAEAVEVAEEMRVKRITSLKKQLAKLDKLVIR